MGERDQTFRMAVRKFQPFESALAKQWESFERHHQTGLRLDAVALDLLPLHESLFLNRGLELGEWDAAMISTDWVAEAADSNALLNLVPLLETAPPDGFPHAWSDSLLRLQRFDDRVLGLPYHDGPECLVYREDLFQDPLEQHHFEQQFGEPLEVPRTWEQFRRIARFFTRPEQSIFGTAFAAFPDGHNTVYDFCLQLWTRGGELFDKSGRMMLNTSQAHEALDFYRMLLNDPSAVHPGSTTFDSVKSGLAFAAGQIAMMVNWFGFASMSETIPESKVKGRVAVAPVPSGGGPRASLNAYWIVAIASGCRHRNAAWNFIRHATSAGMDKLLTLEGGIGCRKSTWRDEEVNAVIPFYHCLEDLHEGARELPRLSNWSQFSAVIDRMVMEAIESQESTPAILQRAQRLADEGCLEGAPRA